MNFSNVGSVMGMAYQYANRTQKTAVIDNFVAEVQKANGVGNVLSFSQIFSEVSQKDINVNDMFSAAFPGNDVAVKAGNCNVSDKMWERRDFPFWQYFQDNVSVDSLNNWRSTGVVPMGAESYIQQELSKIGFGEMVVLMPESLQKKMESNPEYAQKIMEKVQKWKMDYDRMDNVIAASYGDDPVLFQMTKSYCIQLDEEGNVENYTVVGGGMDTKRSEDRNEIEDEDEEVLQKHISKAVKQKAVQRKIENLITGMEAVDFEMISPYITADYKRRK